MKLAFTETEKNTLCFLDKNEEKIFYLLYILKAKDFESVNPRDLEHMFLDFFDLSITRQKIIGTLLNSNMVKKQKQHNKLSFRILKAGIDYVEDLIKDFHSNNNIIFVEPEKSFSGLKKIEELVSELNDEIIICDPYVDKKTFDILNLMKKSTKINLLTLNISEPRMTKRFLDAFNVENNNKLEVKISKKGKLHDRYLINIKNEKMFTFGQSLNGLGKKQCFITQIGKDICQEVYNSFLLDWNSSEKF